VNEREGLRRLQQRAIPFAERHAAMLLFLPIVWWLAVQQHHLGHTWGDDFTLYLRQAKSLFDGNIGQVIADNHFNVNNAAKPGFSPYVYPWGWPILLSPFVRLFGIDYARLKLIDVAALCAFLWVFHEVIRKRATRWVAFGIVVCIGTTLAYLTHTDYLLSEYPYMLGVAVTFWWLDRCRRHHQLDRATHRQLVVLGLLAVAVFNVRREGLAIVPAIAAVQLLDLRGRWGTVSRRRVITPYVTFVLGVILFQFLLPSALAPSYEDAGLHQTWKKLQGPFRTAFASQLGMPSLHGVALLLVFLLVVTGIVVRVWRAPKQDLPLAVFAIGSMTIAGMIPAIADRYLLAVTPFAIYFAAQALAAIPLPRHAGQWVAVAALGVLSVHHLPDVTDAIDAAQRSRDSGQVVDGPESAYAQAAWSAIRSNTHQDDIVAFFKVRALTFYTDRRGVQSSDLDIVRQRADFFMMRRDSTFSQPLVSLEKGERMGWTVVWQDDTWVLWRVRMPSG
jgi:cytochrome b subunit of formate dehydrogenase